jgi:hypothetical protein
VALLVVLLFPGAILLGRVFFERDIVIFFVAQAEAMVQAVAKGAWPVWDPLPAFGQPLTNPDAMLLYPLTLLNLVMQPWTYYTVFVAFHAVFSGVGFLKLCRFWGIGFPGALLSAALWLLSGPFLSLVCLWHHFAGAAWAPWVVLATECALVEPTLPRALLWGGALAGQILAGSADMCALTGLLCLLLLLIRGGGGPGRRLRLLGAGALALGFATGLTAGLWLVALDLLHRGGRGNFSEAFRNYWSVHPLGLLGMAVPDLFTSLPLSPAWNAALFESREPFLKSLYLGAPTLVLAVGALVRGGRTALWLLLVAAGGALVALGRHAPVLALLSLAIPPLKILRYPVKATILVAFAAAGLAGLGFDSLGERGRTWPAVLAAGLVALLTALLAVLVAAPQRFLAPLLDPGVPPDVVQALASLAVSRFALEAGVGVVLVLLLLVGGRRSRVILALVAVGDLFLHHHALNPVAGRELYGYRPELASVLGSGERVYIYDYHQSAKALEHLGTTRAYVPRSHPAGWGPAETGALALESALIPPISERFLIPTGFEVDYRGLQPLAQASLTALLLSSEGSSLHTRLLRMGGIQKVVALHDPGDLVHLQTVSGLLERPMEVFGVPGALPRTYLVNQVLRAAGEKASEALTDPGFDPRTSVIVPEEAPLPPPSPAFAGESRVREERPDRLVLDATLSGPGYLVVLDAYDPGWRASVDGREAPLYPANTAFRAVFVSGGNHRVEIVYRPPALFRGLALGGVTLLGGLLLLALSRHTRGGKREASQPAQGRGPE